MKAMKWITLSVVAAAVACTSLIAACTSTEEEPDVTEYTVTYYDGETVLKTETVEEGEKATEWTPTKDGYSFDGWYATPNFAHEFDFDTAINEDTSVFSKWSSTAQVDDTRTFYICGQGSSSVLGGSAVLEEGAQMTKTEGKNEYTITVDLYEGDWFQFVTNTAWDYQRGWGYMTTGTINGVEYFASNGSIDGTKPTKMEDIVCKKDGNYTFTLTTHPADDLGKPTELSNSDTITFTYNGEPTVDIEAVPEYYIKGANITSWANMYNDSTQLTDADEDGVYTLSVYLKQGEQFVFYTITREDGVVTEGVYINANNLDGTNDYVAAKSETSKDLVALVSGLFTFNYDTKTSILSVTCDNTYTPETYVYYLDGAIDATDTTWGAYQTNPESYALSDEDGDGVYIIENIQLTEGDEIIVRQFEKDESLVDNWGTISYNYAYLAPNGAFSQPEGGTNILVNTSGVYDISFDSYSKMIAITIHTEGNDIYDIYIKGSVINSWAHNFADEYKMTISSDETYYEMTVTLTDGDEFGLARYSKGVMEGNGDFINSDYIGTSGDANSLFVPEGGGDFKCSVAGTYRIVYNIEDDTVDFYAVD